MRRGVAIAGSAGFRAGQSLRVKLLAAAAGDHDDGRPPRLRSTREACATDPADRGAEGGLTKARSTRV